MGKKILNKIIDCNNCIYSDSPGYQGKPAGDFSLRIREGKEKAN